MIALQFVPNPENFVNRKDRLPYTLSKKRYTDKLPEGSIPITWYKGFTFIDYYFNQSPEEILKKAKERFQYLSIKDYSNGKQFSLIDTNKVQHLFGLKTFLRTFQT